MKQTLSTLLLLALVATSSAPAAGLAQDAAASSDPASGETASGAKPAPYDERLVRLAEVMGSVHYLRNLCGQTGDEWRTAMQQLLDTEARNEIGRRERFTAGFNRGFRTFASVYTSCTGSAVIAEENYRAEGATLIREIVARYGN